VIQKEASRKRWRVINASTRGADGGLTISVKVPMANGGHNEFRTKDRVFNAVSPIILERFQSALVAPCHRGIFFEDVGHLADDPVV
jgi:hypothetical protein